jgi:hypothetical protein
MSHGQEEQDLVGQAKIFEVELSVIIGGNIFFQVNLLLNVFFFSDHSHSKVFREKCLIC